MSPRTATCSRKRPAPGGKNTCGPTVHPLGGPAVSPGRRVLPSQSGQCEPALTCLSPVGHSGQLGPRCRNSRESLLRGWRRGGLRTAGSRVEAYLRLESCARVRCRRPNAGFSRVTTLLGPGDDALQEMARSMRPTGASSRRGSRRPHSRDLSTVTSGKSSGEP